ncbi:PilL N-terminal domain-containing protein [Xanthomonas translucens pv. translucens]|uniref:Integrating conjugative element protein pill, pfgi-1 n=2 Tax=Xanthomonas campestris pv. translucens TaxID=343 RepID=A0A125PWJ0_XANCT|nr:PilL N-terminal domain-containing protein [Xanthomonas translucens]KWV16565.1 integrating conjugative element protein pill, pfgi-1 [Xanthomonas translucens]QSQ35306.1 PilL N-terminal domain-containing protein [Xanthomonas translucens pv. translucens]QSQ44110.1 PilL N-terminal domain-containing protein [Xanthomonas translucens pv. translucens]
MPPSPPCFHHAARHLRAGVIGLLLSVLASGCATTATPHAPDAIEKTSPASTPEAPQFIPVVRSGRYTLVELAPMAAQRDLLLQTVDVSMPEEPRATVGDGLRHVLKRSGYQLCETGQAVIELYALPLPAAHLNLGPLTLRDALLTLAGPSWELRVDDRTRQVCFEQVSGDATAPAPGQPAADAMQTFPFSGGQP